MHDSIATNHVRHIAASIVRYHRTDATLNRIAWLLCGIFCLELILQFAETIMLPICVLSLTAVQLASQRNRTAWRKLALSIELLRTGSPTDILDIQKFGAELDEIETQINRTFPAPHLLSFLAPRPPRLRLARDLPHLIQWLSNQNFFVNCPTPSGPSSVWIKTELGAQVGRRLSTMNITPSSEPARRHTLR